MESNHLSHILLSDIELFAPTIDALCKSLGYSGRSIFYNIRDGRCGRLVEFRKKFLHLYGLTESDIHQLSTLIDKTKDFFRHFRGIETNAILFAMVSDDFTKLTQTTAIDIINNLRVHHPDLYYQIPAYQYAQQAFTSLPKRKSSYYDKCVAVLESGISLLQRLFPEVEINQPKLPPKSCSLYNVFKILAQEFMRIREPKSYILRSSLVPLNNLDQRAYWCGSNRDTIILSQYNSVTRTYTIFSFDEKEVNDPGIPFRIYFHNNGICNYEQKVFDNRKLYSGQYYYEDDTLTFEWNEAYNPTNLGNHWKLRQLAASQSLRDFDFRTTDDFLNRYELLVCKGYTLAESISVQDVMCSRFSITIILNTGEKYSISYDSYAMLRNISPNDHVFVYKKFNSSSMFFVWPYWNITIPISKFTLW